MNDVLRIYSYNEFVNEFGEISSIDVEKGILTTKYNIQVYLSKHYKWCLRQDILELNTSTIRHDSFICILEKQYKSNGEGFITKEWYLFHNSYLPCIHVDDSIVFFKNTNYKTIKKRNFCRVLIQYEDDGCFLFFEIYKVESLLFDYKGNKEYTISTEQGTFSAKFESRKFVSAFAQVMSIADHGSEFYYKIYMDGRFEKVINKPVFCDF